MITELLPDGGLILCAVSGGADSMYLLERLRQIGYPVAAAHYDHGLRGEASAADAAFVRDWCRERDIPFLCEKGDVAAYAAEKRLGTEEAAREMRYAFLERAADKLDAAVIATAHTADDNTETVLMHLVRGAGLKGLGGIPPVRGRIVRPMLDVTRAEVNAYLEARQIPHAEDATNAEDIYMRNRLRHGVIPLLRRENPALDAAVGRTARLLREDEAYLDGLAKTFLAENLHGGELPAAELAALPKPVARRVVRQLAGTGLSPAHTDRVLALLTGGGALDLPGGIRAAVSEGRIAFAPADSAVMPERTAVPGKELLLPEAGYLLRCEKIRSFPEDVHKSFNTFFFQYEKIQGCVTVSSRRPGDRYRPSGRGCTKTLKALFMEYGVPAWQRDRVPILRDDEGILAVFGMPAAERAAADGNEADLLKIEFIRLGPEREG